jgi:nitrogen regulatory protein PII
MPSADRAHPQGGAHGRPGDGVVYAVPVEGVVHVRTGRRGREALVSEG